MAGLLAKARYPVVRGMVSYALIWPTCSVVQEYIENGTSLENADWVRAARFGIFGTFFMAPVFYGWMKYTSRFFKNRTLATAMTRAAIEQVSYSPLAMAYFFFGMTALEMKPLQACIDEVKVKFWPTYKYSVIFWPMAQTLNFYFIAERNRIIFVSAASFVWTVYLAHMKAQEHELKKYDPEILSGEDMLLGAMPSSVEGSKAGLEGMKTVGTKDGETSGRDVLNKVKAKGLETNRRVDEINAAAEGMLQFRIQEIEAAIMKGAQDIAAMDMEETIGEEAHNIEATEEAKTVVTEGVRMVAAEAGDRAVIESVKVAAGDTVTEEEEEAATEEGAAIESIEAAAGERVAREAEEVSTAEGLAKESVEAAAGDTVAEEGEEFSTEEGSAIDNVEAAVEDTVAEEAEVLKEEGAVIKAEEDSTEEIITGEGMDSTATDEV